MQGIEGKLALSIVIKDFTSPMQLRHVMQVVVLLASTQYSLFKHSSDTIGKLNGRQGRDGGVDSVVYPLEKMVCSSDCGLVST